MPFQERTDFISDNISVSGKTVGKNPSWKVKTNIKKNPRKIALNGSEIIEITISKST